MTASSSADEAIRAAGLRVTSSRRAIFDALRSRPHADADAIFDAVRPLLPSTCLQSVYNALSDFTEAGIVRRIEPAGHPMLFELRVGDNHHHIVCSECGAVADVACAIGHAPCLEPSDAHGFTVSSAEVTYWGRCPACAAAEHHTETEGTE